MKSAPHQVSRLLKEWSDGDETALEELMPLVYDELHRLAHAHMRREGRGHILQTSALINEAYLRLVDQPPIRWENRAHFFGIAARLMRRILVDEARKRDANKRGGTTIQVPIDEVKHLAQKQAANVIALDGALKNLETIDPRQCEIVELRFFGGLTLEQAAECLNISLSTADRGWRYARAWLYAAMAGGESQKK